jgi:hypothetical protein
LITFPSELDAFGFSHSRELLCHRFLSLYTENQKKGFNEGILSLGLIKKQFLESRLREDTCCEVE